MRTVTALVGFGATALLLIWAANWKRSREALYEGKIGPPIGPGTSVPVRIGQLVFFVARRADDGLTISLEGDQVEQVNFDADGGFQSSQGTEQGIAIIKQTMIRYPEKFQVPASIARTIA